MSRFKKPIDQSKYKAIIVSEIQSKNKSRRVIYICNQCLEHRETELRSLAKNKTGCCNHCFQSLRKYKTPTIHGLSNHPNFRRWSDIKKRCYNKKSINYQHYGKRGISMFPVWINNVELFHKYISSLENCCVDGYSLDRINNDKNYEPKNLRFAKQIIQVTNVRTLSKNNTSGYRGVSYNKDTCSYRAMIQWNKNTGKTKTHSKAKFKTALEAAIYRDQYIVNNKMPHKLNNIKDKYGKEICKIQ